jgi:hypothetical protein
MVSSGKLRRVALVRTDVSEELSASFIGVTRIGELGTTLAVTGNRHSKEKFVNHLYCDVPGGSVTNNLTWVRIGYGIYSLWRLQLQQVTITKTTRALVASRIPLTKLHCTDLTSYRN